MPIGLALLGVLVLHFVAASPLWLDEAQSVAIADRPVPALLEALRHDGSPPLYYLLLHGWMQVFGTSTFAVRALSGVISLVGLPLAYLLGRKLTGRPATGIAAALIFAAMPWSVRYATETRMYMLVAVLTMLLLLALGELRARPRVLPTLAVAVCAAAVALTHYWAFFLLGALALHLVAVAWRRPSSRPWSVRGLAALVLAGVLFLPWVPGFLFQLHHTGTPWAPIPSWASPLGVFEGWAGTASVYGVLLALVYTGLALLGFAGVAGSGWTVRLDLRGSRPGRLLASIGVLTLVLAVVAGHVSHGAWVTRYTAVVVPLAVLVMAVGLAVLPDLRVRRAVLAAAVVLGLIASMQNAWRDRTQAGQVAAVLQEQATANDVVAYCPDQLGPPVYRLFHDGPPQLVYPTGASPEMVDWVDYAERHREAPHQEFARRLVDMAGSSGTIYLVYAPGYATYGSQCASLLADLTRLRGRPEDLVPLRHGVYEPMSLRAWAPK